MDNNRIVVARLWARYDGGVSSRSPIILGMDPGKYETICIYLKKSCDAPNYFEEKGCKVFYISTKKFFRIFNFVAIYKLAKVFKAQKVGILHCHKHQATVYGVIAAVIARVPVVFAHVHGLNRSKNVRRKFINWVVLRWVNRIFSVGTAVKEDIVRNNFGLNPDKVISLGNSIDCRRFSDIDLSTGQARERIGLPPGSVVFGTVGRLAPTKGQCHLIEAFSAVKENVPDAHLVFVGTGRLKDRLQQQAGQLGLDGSVHFLGNRTDVPEVLTAMDVFVLPSIAEGLPRSLLEAMAAGVPCVATSVGGIPEILANGEYGTMVAPESPGELAEAMQTVYEMKQEKRRVLAEKLRQRVVDKYSHEVVIGRLEGIYQSEYNAWMHSQNC